jgi:hypothetical protein
MLEALQKKAEEPDGPKVAAVNVTVDLGDEKQLQRAKSLGLLGALFGSDDDDEDGEDEEAEEDEAPKRRSYFEN